MFEGEDARAEGDAPWHLWLVGLLSVLWNGAGAYTIIMAQLGRLDDIEPAEAAYYAGQPTWFAALTDVALIAGLAAGVALLLRSRWSPALYALSIALIAVTAIYDVMAGTAYFPTDQGALIVTGLIWCLAIAEWLYARTMAGRGLLY